MRACFALMSLPLLAGVLYFYPAGASVPEQTARFESIGALTYAPDGTLFFGDAYGAAIWAVAIEDQATASPPALEVRGLDQKVASLLGTTTARVRIHDLAVHPGSGNVYLSVSRGAGAAEADVIKSRRAGEATSHLVRVTAEGGVSEVELDDRAMTSVALPSPIDREARDRRGERRRVWSVVELAFAAGQLYASGLSNEEWSSQLLRIPYPFTDVVARNPIRIFHTAHGRWETGAPARVFVPYERDGRVHLFAGFSCTPLVDLDFTGDGSLVVGRTVAELGAGNHVLDMIAIERAGRRYALLANHLHPFMALPLDPVAGAASLTRWTNGAGIDRTFLAWRHVERLARLGSDRVVLLQRPEGRDGRVDLRTVAVDELPI